MLARQLAERDAAAEKLEQVSAGDIDDTNADVGDITEVGREERGPAAMEGGENTDVAGNKNAEREGSDMV